MNGETPLLSSNAAIRKRGLDSHGLLRNVQLAGTMVWQQKLTPTDPRQAAMAYMMPVIMTVFFYAMPSGLVKTLPDSLSR